MTTATNRLTGLELDFVSLVPAGDDPMAQVVIAKTAPAQGEDDSATDTTTEETMEKYELPSEVADYIKSLESEVETLSGQVEKSENDNSYLLDTVADMTDQINKMVPESVEAGEAISKSLLAKADPAIRALIEKQDAAIREAQEIAKAERDARLEKEYIAKAGDMPNIPGDVTEVANLLRRVADQMSPVDAAEVEKAFRAMDAQIGKSALFGTVGHGGAVTTISKSVEGAAQEIQKANPGMSLEQAVLAVYKSDPRLAMEQITGEGN